MPSQSQSRVETLRDLIRHGVSDQLLAQATKELLGVADEREPPQQPLSDAENLRPSTLPQILDKVANKQQNASQQADADTFEPKPRERVLQPTSVAMTRTPSQRPPPRVVNFTDLAGRRSSVSFPGNMWDLMSKMEPDNRKLVRAVQKLANETPEGAVRSKWVYKQFMATTPSPP